MQHPDLLTSLYQERLREARRRAVLERLVREARRPKRPRSLRRAVGRTVVRIGLAIEARPRQPVTSR